jgi:hypothetical protein
VRLFEASQNELPSDITTYSIILPKESQHLDETHREGQTTSQQTYAFDEKTLLLFSHEGNLICKMQSSSDLLSCTLDSNEFLSKSLRHYVAETFLASQLHSKRVSKNPFFEAISLPGSMGLQRFLSLLANCNSVGTQ